MEIQNITPDELSLKIVQSKKFFLIDTLPEDHFQKVRLPGSRNACVYKVDFLSQVKNFIEDLAGDPLQAVLIEHLKSDDFFLVADFPEATLTVRDARLREKPYCTAVNCDIEGDLFLRGVSRKLSFPATVIATADGIDLEAHFDLDRTEWGINYGSARFFAHLGMHQVFEAISISLRLVLTRTA